MFERRLYYHIDWALVTALLALCALGTAMIYSTTADPTRAMSRMYMTQLYAIVLGLLLKRVMRRESFTAPPLTGCVVAWVAIIAVEIFNPGDASLKHSLASTRPHLEFVPLFFLGHSVMQSRRRAPMWPLHASS